MNKHVFVVFICCFVGVLIQTSTEVEKSKYGNNMMLSEERVMPKDVSKTTVSHEEEPENEGVSTVAVTNEEDPDDEEDTAKFEPQPLSPVAPTIASITTPPPTIDNTTTTPPLTTKATTPPPPTTPTTPAPTTDATTITVSTPPTSTNGTTPIPSPSTNTSTLKPVTTSATSPMPATTRAPAPSKNRRFDGASFTGGIVLSLGIMAISLIAWKFYKARTERNYHTL